MNMQGPEVSSGVLVRIAIQALIARDEHTPVRKRSVQVVQLRIPERL